jgi:hypothetical protein
MDTETVALDIPTSTDTQTATEMPASTDAQTNTDIPTSTDTVETTTSGNDVVEDEEGDDNSEEDLVEGDEVDSEEEDEDAKIIYLVRVNGNISGFSYDKEVAMSWVNTISKILSQGLNMYMEQSSETDFRIYETRRIMYLLSYDTLVHRITCEPVGLL